MNQSLYRIVFNKARGCMMAVSELTSSNAKGKDKAQGASGGSSNGVKGSDSRFGQGHVELEDSGSFGFSKPVIRAINSFVLVSMLIPSLTAPLSAYAQVIADPSAPGKERPTVLNTANGLPQVNIQTPSAKGVSRNKYSRFDVDGRGVIINNSRTNTNTNIGGLVQGNPWLAQGSARIIVNEVNSSNPSYLNGYIEIAGQRAEIIIANPAGISVNGGGFINASSATLTTGTPIINDGGLEGFSVQKGTISINGYGLDASLTDYTGILARAVEVNAGIWANNLQIVTGANQITADQSTSTPIAGVGGAPMFALDVSNLGGMYAGKITLVGTEAGLGVRNAGYLGASGDLSINSEGILINSGLINSSGNTNLSLKGSVDNSGAISSQGNTTIDSKGEIRNSGGISAGGNLGLASTSTITNNGNLSAEGNVNVTSATGISNNGQIYASGNTNLTTGGDILNTGLVAAQGNATLTSTAVGGNITNTKTSVVAAGLTPDGELLGTGDLSLTADGKVSLNGTAVAGNAIKIDSGSLDIAGVTLITGELALNAKKGDLDATGAKISVSREIDLQAAQTLKTDSAEISGGTVTITADAWSNTKGKILQIGAADTNITVANKIDNTEGYIATNATNTNIKSGSLENAKGDILHAGDGTLNLATGQLGLADGMIASNGNMVLSATNIDGSKGVLASKKDLQITVTGEIKLDQGEIGAGGKLNLSADSLNISTGQITSESDLSLKITNAADISNALVASNKTVTIASGALNNDSGTIAGSAVDINTNGQTLSSVSGTIASSGDLNINSGALNNDKGSIQSGGNMVLNTNGQTLTNTNGDANTGAGILSQGTLTINSGDINNDAGYLAAAGKTTLDAKNISNAALGTIVSGDELSINASGDINNTSGQIQAANNLIITAQGNLDSTQGLIATAKQLDIKVEKTLTTESGEVSAETLGIAAQNWNNVKGQVIQTGSADTTINITGTLDNTEGYIATNGQNLSIQSTALNNNLGYIAHAGTGQTNIGTGVLNLTSGQISSNGDLKLTASHIDGQQGAIVSKGAMQLNVAGDANMAGGQIGAGKDLTLNASSLNISEGQLTSQGNLEVRVSGEFNNTNALTASNGNVLLHTGALLNNGGTIAGSAVDINTHGQTLSSVSGTIASSGDLNINSGALNNDKGSIQSAGNMVLNTNGQTLTNTNGDANTGAGILSQGTLTINSGDINNNAGYLAAAGKTTLDAKNISNAALGTIVSGDELSIKASGDINNTSGQIQAAKNLEITSTGNLDSTKGLIATGAKLDLTIGKTLTTDSASVSADALDITAADLSNVKGQIIQTGTADTTITVAGALNNTEGYIASNGTNLSISSASLNNNLGNVMHAGTGQATVTTGKLELAGGQIASNGDLSLSASQIDGKNGSIVSKGAMLLGVTGSADLSGGQIGAGKDLTLNAGSLNVNDGQVTSQTNLKLTVTGTVDANKALIAANNDVNLTTGALNNKEGKIAGNAVEINTTSQSLDNSAGTIASSTTLTINSGALTNDAGSIQAGGNMVIDTHGQALINTGGNADSGKGILSQGTLTLNSGALDNNGGYIAASKQVTITASSVSNNAVGTGTATVKGTIISNDELKITTTAGDLSNVGGQIQSTKNLTLDVKSALDNTQGLIATTAEADIKAASIVNKNTKTETTNDKLDANGQPIIDLATDKVVQETKYDIKGIQAKSVKLTAGDIDNTEGGILATDDLTINSTGAINNTKGMLASSAAATITATSLNNTEGVIQSTKNLTLSLGTGVLDNTKGLLASSADIDIKAGNLINKNTKTESLVNKIDPDTKLVVKDSAGNPVKETKLDIKGIQAKNVTLSTGAIDNTDGGILASETLNIASTGLLNNTKGMLAASETASIVATGVDNTQGTIQSAKALTIDVATGTVNNTQGLIASSTDITIKADTIVNANTKTETLVDKIDPATGLVEKDSSGNPIKETKVEIKGIQGKTVTLNANNVNNTEGGILAIDSLLIKGAGVVNNTKGIISSTGDLIIKDTAAVDDPAPLPAGSPAPTTPPPDTNIASKTQTFINTGGVIVANKKLTIDSKSLTGDGAILNAGTLVDVMQDATGNQVKKNAAGKWVNVVDGEACSTATGCTEVADANVSIRMTDKDGVLLQKDANGQYIKVDADGTPILVNGAPVVVADADAQNAKEMTEGDIKIKLVDTFTQTDKGSIQANGNLDMRTKGDVVNSGLIQASRVLTLQAANIDNKFGGEISAGATQLAATDSITNRGLIDGGFTLLQANEITNTGTGRIYGDQVSILAGSLTNSAENGKAAVIAARERLDIGAYVITNQDGALLMSQGDMAIGKELDDTGRATGQAEAFLNNSATVDVKGKLDINTRLFMNKDLYGTSVSGTSEAKYIVYTKIDAADPGGNSIRFTGGVWDDHTGGFRNCAITAAMNNTLCPTDEQWNALYSTPASGGNASNATYVSTAGSWQRNDGTYVLDTTDGQVFDHPLWRLTFVTKTTAVSGETSKDPANILVGGAMSLNAETAVNDKSKIIVGGNLTVTGDNLQNIGGGGSSVTTQHDDAWYSQVVGNTRMLTGYEAMDWTTVSDYWSSPGEVRYNTVPVHTSTTIDNRNDVVVTEARPSVAGTKAIAGQAPINATATTGTAAVAANGAVTGGINVDTLAGVTSGASTSTVATNNAVAGGALVNGVAAVTSGASTGSVGAANAPALPSAPSPIGKVVRSSNSSTVTLPNNSLYIIQPVDSKGAPKGYLVETDPRFTQSKPWLGSDYMLTQMSYDPALQTKRLGDGYYEQKLIREQIAELTGRRFLEDYSSDEEQYKALMNAGIQFGQQYGLRVGVALTAEQMALLTTDIVWLVEKEVTLPDGTKVKALVPQVYALVKPGDIDGSGNLLSAKSIDLKLKGDMVNSGLMAARGNLSIDANNISNLAGTLKGVDVSLVAAQDIQSIQANISAGNSLKIGAGNDVVIVAGNISAGGNANISAGHNLILAAQERGSQLIESKDKFDKDGNRINKDNYSRSGTYDQTGGSMNIGGSLSMSAGNDFVAQGTQINAGGGVDISAGHDATITTAQKGSYYESVQTTIDKKKKWYGTIKTTTVNTHSNTDLTNSAANINGGSVNINAGHDVTIVGANINGAGGVQIRGANDTNILAAFDIKEKIDTKTVTSNSLGRVVNIFSGKKTDSSVTDIDSTRTAQVTTINGGTGNVSLTAGNTLTLQAPQITGASTTWGGDQQTNLLLAINSKEISHTETSRNLLWQSSQSNGTIAQNAQFTNINVPTGMSSFVGAGGISVQLPKGSDLSTQIANLAKQPGLAYLNDLSTRSDIDWKRVEIINKTWDYKKEGLTAEAAIIVAIVVTALTYGAASGWGATVGTNAAVAAGEAIVVEGAVFASATGTAIAGGVGAATAAGITALATSATIALINNKGDIGAALKELGSKQTVRNIAAAMLTAGVAGGFAGEYGFERLFAETLAGCVSGELTGAGCETGASQAAVMAALQWAGNTLRQQQLASSNQFQVCDSTGACTTPNNMPGLSTGVDGDGNKFGGGRFDESVFCDKAPQICVTSPNDASMKIINSDYVTRNADGGITQFNLPPDVTVNGVPITPYNINITQNPSPLGGVQGGQGAMAGAPYSVGSFGDKLVESFSGPHDAFNAFHYYDSAGNIASGGNFWNYVNVPLTAPMGISTFCSQIPGLCSNVQNANGVKLPAPPVVPRSPTQSDAKNNQ